VKGLARMTQALRRGEKAALPGVEDNRWRGKGWEMVVKPGKGGGCEGGSPKTERGEK